MISLKDKIILVVDDEPGYREVLADEFGMVGATVLTAANGTEAFDVFQKHKIDAIISDVRMAGGNGVEFLDRVKDVSSKTPVMMLITGFSDLSLEDAYDKGADAVFSKPCNLDALVESVRRALLPEKERWGKDLVHLPTDFNVELKFESIAVAIKARVLNIGRGGMFIALEGKLPSLESKVAFCLQSSDGAASSVFEGQGVCRWFRQTTHSNLPKGMGIEFTNLTEYSLQVLLKLLDDINPRAFIPKGVILK